MTRSAPRVLVHLLAVPPTAIALTAGLASALSATGMGVFGVAMGATWLWPSLRWMLLHQPATVATWLLWLALPAAATVAMVALLHRRVRNVAWWRWAVLGGLAHAALLGIAVAMGGLPLMTATAAPYAAGVGFVLGALATGTVEALLRLARRAAGYRNGLSQETRAAPARGTNVSVRAS